MCLRTTPVLGVQLQLSKPAYAQFPYKPTKQTAFLVQPEGKKNGEGGGTWKLQLSI